MGDLESVEKMQMHLVQRNIPQCKIEAAHMKSFRFQSWLHYFVTDKDVVIVFIYFKAYGPKIGFKENGEQINVHS